MNYEIYTRPNSYGGNYVILEIDGEKVYEKYCGTDIGTKWCAYWLDAKVKAGKYNQGKPESIVSYGGEIK